MKFFKILILCSFCSCSNAYQHLHPISHKKAELKSFSSIFKNQTKATVFNTSLTFKNYFASGLMVIKPLENQHFRIVFTAKMGQTLLDTELTPTDFIIKKSIPQLDRKLLFKLLEKDLRMICDEPIGEAVLLKNENKKGVVFRLKTKKGYRYFYENEMGEYFEKIEHGTKRRPKVVVDLEQYQNDFPEKITFVHKGLPLENVMEKIQ
jgi:hypothetical protein